MPSVGYKKSLTRSSAMIDVGTSEPPAFVYILMSLHSVPSFSDYDALPFVRAFVLETFRWRPGTAAGLQHRATQDILWVRYSDLQAHAASKISQQQYRIPAGTIIIPNHWYTFFFPSRIANQHHSRSIGRDPEFWPNGDDFILERWLDTSGRVQESPSFPDFGFGRRCALLILSLKCFLNAL